MAAPMKYRCISCCNYSFKHVVNAAKVQGSSSRLVSNASSSRKDDIVDSTEGKDSKGFRRYKMKKFGMEPFEARGSKFKAPRPVIPRYTKMPVNQDWTNVWPTAQTFKWSVVPLPLKQGYLKNKMEAAGDGLPPQKRGNTELIKIPNFLHLTPKHIEKHCKAIKKFCTEWPSELETVEDMDYHFPLEVITEDYCFSSPSVRDPRARTVTFKFKASDLEMDAHAKDKWQKLLKSRDNKVTLKANRCPLRKQNYDYLQYLLTALYFESWKVEPWEAEMTPEDMLDYCWDLSHSKTNVVNIINKYREKDQTIEDPNKRKLSYVSEDVSPDSVTSLEPVKDYKQSVEELYMTGENITTINNYKESVLKLLNVQRKTNNSS